MKDIAMTEKEAMKMPLEDDEIKDVPVKIMTVGRDGTTTVKALSKAYDADIRSREQSQYKEYTPCVKCKNCLILRGWQLGKLVTRWYFCRMILTPVAKYGTCRLSRERPKNWYRGIFIDMAGAPKSMPQTAADFPKKLEEERLAAIGIAKKLMAEHGEGTYGGWAGKMNPEMRDLKARLDKIMSVEGESDAGQEGSEISDKKVTEGEGKEGTV